MRGSRKPARCGTAAPTERGGPHSMGAPVNIPDRSCVAQENKNPTDLAKGRVGFCGPPLALAVFISRPQAELKSAREVILGLSTPANKAQGAGTPYQGPMATGSTAAQDGRLRRKGSP